MPSACTFPVTEGCETATRSFGEAGGVWDTTGVRCIMSVFCCLCDGWPLTFSNWITGSFIPNWLSSIVSDGSSWQEKKKCTGDCGGLANDLTVAILTMVTITITASWDVIILCFAQNVSREVKQSRNRPGVAQRVPGGLGSQIFMTFSTWRWWGCQPHAPAAFTSRNVPGTHFH